ncbi:putative uncharacterized protein [Prevotella sp. CAG:474]|uniref:DUF1573 domain-containing protein n=1 Tax=Prevotella TaxID=838 RepID=UPI00033496B1|nr:MULTISPECIES: DUF1573 domain-containing protein [Prevotella]CDC98017.1 putative uncharacterized protein [Prevotella sp. CAG:474]MCF2636458.1 DUF1573 domain-containing protein [Prevotella dentalis]OYP63957.1 DUF1573 domain-containing protein [Prevotella sp. P5-108]OYP65671.1 DUF1573 domain-containing protein [Prevotella sp. P5-64]OYP70782.1 DUF1573 domain-containing protein [Prevotella sp. P4-67]
MKKIFLLLMMLASLVAYAQQEQPEIKFDKTVHNFGTFSEKTPVQTAVFAFTNIGKAPLIINQAIASCGCTIPSYTKEPIMPGEKGTVKVTYNGKGKFPGHFKKSITIRTNGKVEMVRLYIEGDMKEE